MTKTTHLIWASDIHLDHAGPEQAIAFLERVRATNAQGLLLGGDISTALDIDEKLVETLEMVDMPVYFVLGNHDYYRGSIATVRQRVAALDDRQLHWLPKAGVREVAPGVGLIGHGGWGDAWIGDFAGSDVVLTDYLAIAELNQAFDLRRFKGAFGPSTQLQKELGRLGQDAAEALTPALKAGPLVYRRIVVLTHVPPFRQACWHEGKISDENWLPGFTCGAIGQILLEAAAAHPECEFTVLCGHTHGSGSARIADNLVVHTQAAEYGKPDFVPIEINEDEVKLLNKWGE